jgi:hypothetical protein
MSPVDGLGLAYAFEPVEGFNPARRGFESNDDAFIK